MSQQPLNDDKFEALILQYTFAELSKEQKSDLGISDMNAEEYEAIRSVIRELHALDNDVVVPSPELKDTLLKAFDEPPAKEKSGVVFLWSSILAGFAAVFIVAVFVLPRLNPTDDQGAQKENATGTQNDASAESSSFKETTNSDADNPSSTQVQSTLLANNNSVSNTISEDEALKETQITRADNVVEPPAEVKLEFENSAAGAAATEDMEMFAAPSAKRKSEVEASKKSPTTAGSLGALGMDLLTTVY